MSARTAEGNAWIGSLKDWSAVRLNQPELSEINLPGYHEHVCDVAVKLRGRFLTENEMASSCRGNSQALAFGAHVYIEGVRRDCDPVAIAAAMYRTLPEYPYFFTAHDVVSGVCSFSQAARMQMFESEMFAVIHAYITGERDWFGLMCSDTEESARSFWDKYHKQEQTAEDSGFQPNSPTHSYPPPKPKRFSRYAAFNTYLVLSLLLFIYNLDEHSETTNFSFSFLVGKYMGDFLVVACVGEGLRALIRWYQKKSITKA